MVSKAFLQSKGQVMVKGCWETELLDGLSSVGGSWSLHRGSVTQGCRHSGAAPIWHFTYRSATVMAFYPLLKQPDWPSFTVEIFKGSNFFIVWVYYSVWRRLSMWKRQLRTNVELIGGHKKHRCSTHLRTLRHKDGEKMYPAEQARL